MNDLFDPYIWRQVPFHFWSGIFFVFGSMLGSFLNVCIYRLPQNMSVIRPASHCSYCDFSIPWHQNLPILSWLLLHGKCAKCKQSISPKYIFVEFFTGIIFLICWITFGKTNPGIAIVYAFFLAGLIAASWIDIEHFIIPDEITLGGMAFGFLCAMIVPALHNTSSSAESMEASALGIFISSGIIYAILRIGKLLFGKRRVDLEKNTSIIFGENSLTLEGEALAYEDIFYRKGDEIIVRAKKTEMIDRCFPETELRLSRDRLKIGQAEFDPKGVPYLEVIADEITIPQEAMGLGDVKFMGAIGAFLGWQASLFSLIFSSIIGAVMGVGLIAIGKRKWASRLPYGPYIAFAAALWIFIPAFIQEGWNNNLKAFISILQSDLHLK